MADAPATQDRIERERAFHDDRFGGLDDTGRDRFYDHVVGAVDALRAATASLGHGDRVLELGCGTNSLGWELAARGCDVTAIDISPVAVARVEEGAGAHGLTSIDFAVMDAEALDFDDGQFDAVVGTGILHHLDLDRAYREIARALAPHGRGVFYEPLGHNPFINAYRQRTPQIRTVDEHPLLRRDIRNAGRYFETVDASMHECASLAASVAPGRVGAVLRPGLAALDRALLRLPGVRWMAWISVIEVARPRLQPQS